MRAVVQRVSSASVAVDGELISHIEKGLLVLLGVESGDCDTDIQYIVRKVSQLRIFEDSSGRMNLPVTNVGGSVLLISQFTLYGDARKGNRPSFTGSASPETAMPIYLKTVNEFRRLVPVQTGRFGAAMEVSLVNSGPVTILLDSKKLF